MPDTSYITPELLSRLNSHLPADAQLSMEHFDAIVAGIIDACFNTEMSDKQLSAVLNVLWTNEVWEARNDPRPDDPTLFTASELDLLAGQFMLEFDKVPTSSLPSGTE